MRTRPLITAVMLLIILAGLSTVFAIANKLPYEFDGIGDPNTVTADSITHGTAISPPLTMLAVLAALAALTLRRGWPGIVGTLGVMLLAILFLIAGLGEPIIWRTLRAGTFGLVELVILGLSAAGFILSLCILFFSIKGLIGYRRATG